MAKVRKSTGKPSIYANHNLYINPAKKLQLEASKQSQYNPATPPSTVDDAVIEKLRELFVPTIENYRLHLVDSDISDAILSVAASYKVPYVEFAQWYRGTPKFSDEIIIEHIHNRWGKSELKFVGYHPISGEKVYR